MPLTLKNGNRRTLNFELVMYFLFTYTCTCVAMCSRFLMKQGIEVGDVKVLVYVQELQGKKYQLDSKGRMCLHKQWSMSLTTHPLQTLVSV